MLVHGDEVRRAAGRHQTAMECAVRRFPGGVKFKFVGMTWQVARHARQPMEGNDDALLPGSVAVLDAFPQADFSEQAARARQLEQILPADGGGGKPAKVGLADKPIAGGAIERLPQRIEAYTIPGTEFPNAELLSGGDRRRDHVAPEPGVDRAGLGFPPFASLDSGGWRHVLWLH